MFRKKEKQQNTESKLEGKIHLKQRYNSANVQRRQQQRQIEKGIVLKPKKIRNKNPRFEKVEKSKRMKRITGICILLLIPVFTFFIIFNVLKFITNIRGGTTIQDITTESMYVEGFTSVPVYPRSEFVYKNNLDQDIVRQMLSQGISVYRLQQRTQGEDIYNYYKENLPGYDWNFIFTLITSTDEQIFGQYWTKDEKGLRIYVQNNDIWYETVTVQDAETGLQQRREQELQRKRILESSGEQTLLPHYPWSLDISSDYLITYSDDELEKVNIKRIGNKEEYMIIPLGRTADGTFDEYLENFAKNYPDDDEEWQIVMRKYITLRERRAYAFHLNMNGELGEGVLIQNRLNSVIYAIVTNTMEDDFYAYILNNINEPGF